MYVNDEERWTQPQDSMHGPRCAWSKFLVKSGREGQQGSVRGAGNSWHRVGRCIAKGGKERMQRKDLGGKAIQNTPKVRSGHQVGVVGQKAWPLCRVRIVAKTVAELVG